jgi:antitoxin (DNA-binding transcriptional repressor) of toxin-antitoxin stability system
MQYSATEFRKNLFAALDRALHGDAIEISYKGSSFRIVPAGSQSKLARAKRQDILLCDPDSIVARDPKLASKMEGAWRRDWQKL